MTDDVAEVLELERSRLRSLVERDMVVAERIHAADYELITPDGHTRTKATYLGDVASKRLEYLAFEPTSSIAARATPDLIVLRYVARIRLSVGVADEVELSAWHTDHYEKRDGKWTVVWSQATEIEACSTCPHGWADKRIGRSTGKGRRWPVAGTSPKPATVKPSTRPEP